jgi:hypothetical protein
MFNRRPQPVRYVSHPHQANTPYRAAARAITVHLLNPTMALKTFLQARS